MTSLSQATPIIKPIESDRSFIFAKKNNFAINTNTRHVECLAKTEYPYCKYNLNDYRTLRNEVTGCAVNNNSKRSSDNGDICN